MAKKEEIKKEYPQTKEEKLARLKTLARSQNKKAGESVITFGSDLVETERIKLNIPEVDDLLGGGFPLGRTVVLWGNKGSGKTTLALEIVKRCQQEGKVVYYIALEKLDKERAESIGVNLDELIVGEFPQAEKCLDSVIEYARERVVDVIVLDSIHSLSPEAEQMDKNGKEKSMSDDTMALLARKLSQFFRIANHPLAKGNITLLLIGQTRTSLGYIALDTLSGGNALKHYSKLILHIRPGQGKNAPKEHREDENGDGETIQTGFECVIKIDKTQISGTKTELTETRLPFYFQGGFFKKEDSQIEKENVETNDTEVSEESANKKTRGRPKKIETEKTESEVKEGESNEAC